MAPAEPGAGGREGGEGSVVESWPWPPSRPTSSTLAVFLTQLSCLDLPSSPRAGGREDIPVQESAEVHSQWAHGRCSSVPLVPHHASSFSSLTRSYSALSLFSAKVKGERGEGRGGRAAACGCPPPSPPVDFFRPPRLRTLSSWGRFSKALWPILDEVFGAYFFGVQIGWRRQVKRSWRG